ncbi:GNAT family N-acetyltransferase [Rhodoferax sp.]|uniref:GNAT family N-acetyltransferase n=1 Tax=Rhodoferax sp. TaxID=50421 RepID=UPI00374DF8D4
MNPLRTTTERLLLRRVEADDVDTVLAIYGDPATNLYNPAGTYKSSAQAIANLARWRSHWVDHGFGQWAVALPWAPKEVIGFGGLMYRDYGDAVKVNLGYRFSPTAWGHGYATELGRAALQLAFEHLNLPAVHALLRERNTGSVRVVQKLGLLALHQQPDEHGHGLHTVYEIRNPSLPA